MSEYEYKVGDVVRISRLDIQDDDADKLVVGEQYPIYEIDCGDAYQPICINHPLHERIWLSRGTFEMVVPAGCGASPFENINPDGLNHISDLAGQLIAAWDDLTPETQKMLGGLTVKIGGLEVKR